MNKIKQVSELFLSLYSLFFLFLILQILNVTIFLGNKYDPNNFDFQFYLNSIKFTTLFLLLHSLIILIVKFKSIKYEFNKLTIATLFFILTIYFTMVIHTDRLVILSPTFLLLFILFILFTTLPFELKNYLVIAHLITYINLIIVILQVLKVIPIAQENFRDSLIDIGNRPTGIFFNAFAMGYAMGILYFVFLNEIYKFKLNLNNLLGMLTTIVLIYLSGTRTVLIYIVSITIIIFLNKKFKLEKKATFIVYSTATFIISLPLILIFIGNIFKINELSSLNGRAQLWSCVTNKWMEFLPFGVGVQAAFPQGFCSDDPWFSKLRHPENMFLLSYVEAGFIGVLSLITIFVIALKFSVKNLKEKEVAPFLITTLMILSSMFYVPLFHYIPFLPNRTADRGVFNFYLMILIWLISLRIYNVNKNKSTRPKKY